MNFKLVAAIAFSVPVIAAPPSVNGLVIRSDDSCINIQHDIGRIQNKINDLKNITKSFNNILDDFMSIKPGDSWSDHLATLIVEVTHQIQSVFDLLNQNIFSCVAQQIQWDIVNGINTLLTVGCQLVGVVRMFIKSGFKLGAIADPLKDLVNTVSQYFSSVTGQVPIFGGANKELVLSFQKALNRLLDELKDAQ